MSTLLEKGRRGESLAEYGIIDMHAHLMMDAVPWGEEPADHLVRAMDQSGVRKSFVSSLARSGFRMEACNEVMYEALQKYPDRLLGYVYIWPGDPKAVRAEAEQRLAQGFSGIKMLVLMGYPYVYPGYAPAFEIANERRLPVLLHTYGGQAGLDDVPELAERYPDANFVLAHAGAQQVEHHIRIAGQTRNTYMELCTSSATYRAVETLFENVPLERIVWGADDIPLNMSHQIGKVLGAQVPEEAKLQILSGNARRLLSQIRT
jgi:predicted TIM-barrel fold metal-dependent hydrolase